eukprot:3283130-Prymnesium_polylepis.1
MHTNRWRRACHRGRARRARRDPRTARRPCPLRGRTAACRSRRRRWAAARGAERHHARHVGQRVEVGLV